MKQQIKVKYFSPDQAKYINPDLIDYVTLNNGSTIKIGGGHNLSQSFCQNPNFCNRCGKAKYMGQPNNYYSAGSSFVFRGGKKNANQTELSGAGIEIAPEGVKKENLKGAEGSLLTDILSGGGFMGGDQNGNQGQIPQEQGQDEGYYDGTQQGTVPQQYVPVPEQNQNPVGGYTNEYADPNQYYPGGQNPVTNINDAISYPSGNPQGQPQGVQEEYVNPGMPNENYPQPQPHPQQDYPQQPEEQIPVETPYIPVKPVSEQPVIPVQEPVIPTQPYPQPSQSYSYQQPSQQYPQPSQQYPQPSQQYPQPYPQYQQPSQSYPYQQPSQQYQQPMEQQPFIPPQVIPASNTAKTNAPVQQTNTSAPAQNKNNTSGPKSFKQLFKEARKEAEKKIKQIKNNVFRARKKEVQSNICPKCHLPKEILCPDCQREDDESRLNSQRNTYTDDQQKDIEVPQINYKDNNNQNNDNDNLSPRKSNYQNEQPNSNRNPQRDNNNNNNNRRNNQGNDNNNNRRNNQGNDRDNNRRNPLGNDRGDNNRRNNQGNDKDNNRRNPLRNDNKNNRRNDYGNNKDNNRRNNQGNDNNRRNNYGNDNNRRNNQGNDKNNYRNNNKGNDGNDFGHYRRKSQGNDYKRFDVNRTFDGIGRRSANQSHLRGNSDYRYSSRTYERNEEYNMDLDNYRYYETNNTINQNRRTITIVKRGDFIIANHD